MQRTQLSFLLFSLALSSLLASPSRAARLLPDLIPWDYDEGFSLSPRYDTETIANRVLYRFRVAIPNIGDGPMEVREVTDGTVSQTVYQRIYTTDEEIEERTIGTFPNPANTFGHLWFQGLAQYNLYEANDDGQGGYTRGDLVSSQDKTSMGIVDSSAYDLDLPGAPVERVYESALDPLLGISVGWADVYGRELPGQWVDVTGLGDGPYWLEVVIDPYGVVEELVDTNNTTDLLVHLEIPSPQIHPGDYNQDGVVDAADYTVWRNTLGTTGLDRGTAADGNGDGQVTVEDYDVWRSHFGEMAPLSLGQATAVPEPASAALLLVVCLAAASAGRVEGHVRGVGLWLAGVTRPMPPS